MAGDKQDSPTPDGSPTRGIAASAVPLFLGTVLISAVFLHIIQGFLLALCLAAICAVLARPLFLKLRLLVRGRDGVASALTLLICMVAVIAPLMLISYEAALQAADVIRESDDFLNILAEDVQELKDGTLQVPDWFPYEHELEQAGPQIYDKAYELLSAVATYFASSLSHLTNGTATFFLSLFTFLYAMFFFLPMKTSAFAQLLTYSRLSDTLQAKLDSRIISVSRATIKGTLLIGVIQGGLGGLGFWLAGFEGAIFWSVIMALLAAIPAVGATPVIFCGAIYLGFEGEFTKAAVLALWGMLVVGSIDNVLRPRLVGKDAGMSDLWIFVSTLGGLGAFGVAGLVLGPVFAGLFITMWTEFANPSTAHSATAQETPSTPQAAPGDDN